MASLSLSSDALFKGYFLLSHSQAINVIPSLSSTVGDFYTAGARVLRLHRIHFQVLLCSIALEFLRRLD